MFTDEQQRSRERIAADAIMARHPDLFQCRGYDDHFCIVMLAAGSGRTQCRSCARMTPDMQKVADILRTYPPFEAVVACPCGGDSRGHRHEESLLHLQWIRQHG